jgi:hypothetical protein
MNDFDQASRFQVKTYPQAHDEGHKPEAPARGHWCLSPCLRRGLVSDRPASRSASAVQMDVPQRR